MVSPQKSLCLVALLCILPGSQKATATNGMNLEGYGAKSHALGGAGMAFDTGNSAVMNNPATLALMEADAQRIGIGIRGLHPDVNSAYGGSISESGGDAYYMPTLSYIRRDGKLSWGFALLAQGGMGTEYGDDAVLFAMGKPMSWITGDAFQPMSGEDIRSEVSMGRVMFPVAYDINEQTSFGWSLDFVWASMDLQMDMDGYTFRQFQDGVGGSVGGSMASSLDGFSDINYARFDFSNSSDFTGEADGYGWGLKAGIMHKLNDRLTVGASYHSQTHISDLETSHAQIAFAGIAEGSLETHILDGTIEVKDFEWPEIIGLGIAYRPAERWMLVSDVKLLNWSAVMKNFTMVFTAADDSTVNGDFAGQEIEVTMKQEWDDQVVLSVGAEYQAGRDLWLRAGGSFATNPVADDYLNPLFPAIVRTHYTGGFGYRFLPQHKIAAAFAYVPEVTVTNGNGVMIYHAQANWSMNYSYTF